MDEIIEIPDDNNKSALPDNPDPVSKPFSFAAEVYGWVDWLLYSVLAIVVVFTLFTRMSTVDGTSMLPTLEDGQKLMITDFFYEPAYNDIIVVWADKLPNDDDGYGKAIVKRVIGLSGDTISIDFARGRVSRNGIELDIETRGEDILYEDGHKINSMTRAEEGLGGEFTVPDGCIFVMGDNRNGSTDSRSPFVGYVDKHNIIGKAYFRILPFDKIGGLYE